MKKRFAQFSAVSAFALLAGFFSSPASAQNPVATDSGDALGISTSFGFSASGKTTLESHDIAFGQVEVRDYSFAASQQFMPGLNVGIGYDLHDLGPGSGASKAPLPERLQSLTANISYTRTFNERWTGRLFVSPGYRVAGTTLLSGGLGVTTGAFATRQYSDTLSWSLGVAFDSLARGNRMVLPIGGLEWKFAPAWTLSLGVPRTALSYDLTDKLQLALCLEGNYDNYYVREDPQPGATGHRPLNHTRLEYTEARGGLSARYSFTPTCTLSATVGTTIERQFNYHKRDFKLKADDTALYGAVGCNFSF